MKNILLKKFFGNSPYVKVTELLLIGKDFGYTLEDIHEGTGVSRITVKKIVTRLLDDGIIRKGKKVGRSYLYTINLANPIVCSLNDLLNEFLKRQEELLSE